VNLLKAELNEKNLLIQSFETLKKALNRELSTITFERDRLRAVNVQYECEIEDALYKDEEELI